MRTSFRLVFVLFAGMLFGSFSCAEESDTDNPDYGLKGSWVLIGYENFNTGSIEYPPENASKIWLELLGSEVIGNTGRNDFYGSYRVQKDSLIVAALNGTEINESSWGARFLDSIRQSYSLNSDSFELKYSLNMDLLKVEYKSGQFLLFERAN